MTNEHPRILCVDDEKNVLEGLTRTLRSLYEVETAVGGAQGLERLKNAGTLCGCRIRPADAAHDGRTVS